MKYEKPEVGVVRFDSSTFIRTSGEGAVSYSSAGEALAALCGGYGSGHNDKPNRFSCNVFGGYSDANPPKQNDTVTVGGGVYVFDYVGNHWKCSSVK